MGWSFYGETSQNYTASTNQSWIDGYASISWSGGSSFAYVGTSTVRLSVQGNNYDYGVAKAVNYVPYYPYYGSLSGSQTLVDWTRLETYTHDANGWRDSKWTHSYYYNSYIGNFDYNSADYGVLDFDRRPWTPSVQSASRDRGSITMYLNDPGARNSGPARDYWQYRYSTNNTDPWTEASYTASTTQTFSGTPTQTYYFQFRAYNSDGWGDYGNNWGIHGVPNTPSIPGATRSSTTAGAIDVSWSAPSSNLTIDQYAVDRYSANGQTYIGRIYSGGTATSKQDTGLTRGATYTYRVYAHNSSGWSDISSYQTTPIMAPGVPSIPGTPTIYDRSGRTITISSTRGSSDYGNTISEYRIQLSTDNGVTWKGWNEATKTFTANGTYNTLDGNGRFKYTLLTPALTYKWRVYAVNSIGAGDMATTASGTFVGAGGKRWTGSAWEPTSTSKRWDGSTWQDFTTAKRWDGSTWADLG